MSPYLLLSHCLIFLISQRLNQSLLDHELKDSSHKTLLQELEETQVSVSRLTAHHARAVGLDTRLTAVMREKEDLQQERDCESQRAKIAEMRIAVLQERTSEPIVCFLMNFSGSLVLQPNYKQKFDVSRRILNNGDSTAWNYLKKYCMKPDHV